MAFLRMKLYAINIFIIYSRVKRLSILSLANHIGFISTLIVIRMDKIKTHLRIYILKQRAFLHNLNRIPAKMQDFGLPWYQILIDFFTFHVSNQDHSVFLPHYLSASICIPTQIPKRGTFSSSTFLFSTSR